MKRRSFLKRIGLTVAAMPLVGCGTIGASKKPAQAVSGSHKILCCNVRVPQPVDEREGDGWEARKELCADVMKAQNADIICMQECQSYQLDYLKKRMPRFASYGLSNPGPQFHPLNAIMYSKERYDLISCGGFWLSLTPHVAGSASWDSARSRFCNWVDLKDKASGVQFRLWNTHFDHLGHVAREQQAVKINEGCEPLGQDLPQVLTADFNADAKHPAIAKLMSGGWIDTYGAVHGPQDPGFTFHGFKGPKHAEKNPKAGKIDWIFCRGPVKTLAAEIIRDGRNGRWPSDHYFISAVVDLGTNAAAAKSAK